MPHRRHPSSALLLPVVAVLLLMLACVEEATAVPSPGGVDRSHCHVGMWDKAPMNVPLSRGKDPPALHDYGGVVDGPISGNGDFGLVVGTNENTPTAAQGSWLLMYVDTMHFRDVDNDVGAVGARDESGGKRGVGFLRVGPATNAKASATSMRQDITNATVHTVQTFKAYSLHTRSFVSATETVMVTKLWCEGSPCKVTFEMSPIALQVTGNHFAFIYTHLRRRIRPSGHATVLMQQC